MSNDLIMSSYSARRFRGVVFQDDTFRFYGIMFRESYCRARIWNELAPEEWLKGKRGGYQTFYAERGRPSKRRVRFGDYEATVTVRFDDYTDLTDLDIDVHLPEGLTEEALDELVATATRMLRTEFHDGRVELDQLGPDWLRIDWFGLRIDMTVQRGDRPKLAISMRPADVEAEVVRAV